LITPGGTSVTGAQDRFSYAPVVGSISPAFGPSSGGTRVTITGVNLTGVTGVQFGAGGAGMAQFKAVNDTTVTAVAPRGTGVVDVTVSRRVFDATGTQDQYAMGSPFVGSVAPTSGQPAGGSQ
jgi:hypothetical protein